MSRKTIIGDCPICGKKDVKFIKGACYNCYKRVVWKRKLIECPRCHRMKPMHARGFCRGCYMSLFFIERVKEPQYAKRYSLTYEQYNKITTKCVICGFDKIVALHHLDKNRKNASDSNLVGLCPNHHNMIHHRDYQDEVIKALKERGYQAEPLIKGMPTETPQKSHITLIKLIKTGEPEQSQARKEELYVPS